MIENGTSTIPVMRSRSIAGFGPAVSNNSTAAAACWKRPSPDCDVARMSR
jgi:hypothetical protein